MKLRWFLFMLMALAFALTAGCGGSSPTQSTVLPNQLRDETLTYPAFHARGPEGENLYLQIQSRLGRIQGSFYFFVPYDEEMGITSGRVTGTEAADGRITLDLNNPFSADVDPVIRLVGRREGNGYRLADIEKPSETFFFARTEAASSTGRGRSPEIHMKFRIATSEAGIDSDAALADLYFYDFPLWFLPPTMIGELIPDDSANVFGKGNHWVYIHTWGNGWSWVDVHVAGRVAARLWVKTGGGSLNQTKLVFSEDSTVLHNGQWVRAYGKVYYPGVR